MIRWAWMCFAIALAACTTGEIPALDAGPDTAAPPDAGPLCGCRSGLHASRIFLLSDDAELWTFDPVSGVFDFFVGPVCATSETPYSMAVDPAGRAWILYAETRRILDIDVNALAACEDSGYLPTLREFPLFGMSFLRRDDCARLYALSYNGEGPFAEGEDLGVLGVMEGDPPRMRALAPTDYNGGELAGSGDGRLFAFAGVMPAKLVEYDPDDGSVIEIFPLEGFSKTNASAFAFFGGDIYFFTEALPEGCVSCLETACATEYSSCRADELCSEQIACAIERGRITDACGSMAGEEMVSCLTGCGDPCLARPSARVSQVTRLDWDRSDGPERALTVEVSHAPMRVVGAGTSPCVPVIPF
jgi:hypothetical protein